MTGITTFDPDQYKASIRAEWRAAAPGWCAWVEVLEAEDGGGAVSRTLVELARIGPGDAVLDVAAGYGEPGLTAARTVAPGGRVICTDISPEMLAVGRERAAAEGLDNLQFVKRDAEELRFEEASFDAVLSRQGLQFLPDVSGVLTRLHAFLKPHGRLAAAVWGPPGTVQFAAPVPIFRAELQVDRGHGAGLHVGEPGLLNEFRQLGGVGEREGTRDPGGRRRQLRPPISDEPTSTTRSTAGTYPPVGVTPRPCTPLGGCDDEPAQAHCGVRV
jgi:SAM-dependent methyltransferase